MALPLLAPTASKAVYVMRHGRTVLDDEKRSDGWLDYPLSDKGRVGLITAFQYLKHAPITKVYAPSLRRAHETAHIVASGILSRPDVVIAEQARTWNLGALIGTKKRPNKPIVQYFMDHPDQAPLAGESMLAFQQRFLPWLMGIVKQAAAGKGPFLVVTSGSNLREISRALTGDTDTFDMDESGLMVLTPDGAGAKGSVVFGHKSEDQEWDS